MGFTNYERRDVLESYSIHLCDLTVKDTYQYPPQPSPLSPSIILLTLQMRSVMMRPMASQGLLGPLATVEATMGARERTMTAPSNTWENTQLPLCSDIEETTLQREGREQQS